MKESAAILEALEALLAELPSTQGNALLKPDENLFTSGIVDSVGIMQLVEKIETHFALKIPPRDLLPRNFRSLSSISTYVGKRVEEAATD
ncbi:MAG: acyl carrier protein [Verrucomicrobiales bacterium]